MNDVKKGYLIVFEGGEGGGKTTQTVRLNSKLSRAGKKVLTLREPGGNAIGEKIRNILLSAENIGMAYETEVLLFQAARAQIYEEMVIPSLKAGKVVMMDRSRDSSLVYQGIVRGFGKDLIEQLNNIATQNTYSDLTFLLDVPVKTGLGRRLDSGKMDRLDMESLEFHEKVRQAYLDLAREDTSGRWVVIDASRSMEDVEADIWEVVQKRLGL